MVEGHGPSHALRTLRMAERTRIWFRLGNLIISPIPYIISRKFVTRRSRIFRLYASRRS
jgi:hypothetical protein